MRDMRSAWSRLAVILLGSTGSIGLATLEVARQFAMPIEALGAGRNITLLNQQIATYRPKYIAIAESSDKARVDARGARVFIGEDGICEMLDIAKSHLVINAMVGFAGLKPSLHAQYLRKTLALANKESLVAGGWLLDRALIRPIDSEHFGLWYLQSQRAMKRLIITASGGAFRDTPIAHIPHATKELALCHPTWNMGQKITIDSASMMNKMFEILEAYWLFGTKEIDAYIERSSSIHALIEFLDGSITAHYATPNMRLPIAYALDAYKAERMPLVPMLSLTRLSNIAFEEIDTARYPLYSLKEQMLREPKLGVILNASNECAVAYFLRDRCSFGAIERMITDALDVFSKRCKNASHTHSAEPLSSYEDIQQLDAEVRLWCEEWIASHKHNIAYNA